MDSVGKAKKVFRLRNASRLVAVQAVYQGMQNEKAPLSQLGKDFVKEPLLSDMQKRGLVPDFDYLCTLLSYFKQQDLRICDGFIDKALTPPWQTERLEPLLLALLRVGTVELLYVSEKRPAFIINAYVALAHGFFGGSEPGLVRAVLGAVQKDNTFSTKAGKPCSP